MYSGFMKTWKLLEQTSQICTLLRNLPAFFRKVTKPLSL